MGLVPAEIVARADIDDAEYDGGLRARQTERQGGGREAGSAGLEKGCDSSMHGSWEAPVA